MNSGLSHVKIKKSELLSKLKTNKTNHEKEYNEALSGYQEEVIERLIDALDKAKNEKIFSAFVYPEKPVNYIKDYNTVIKMLEMSVDKTIELTYEQFEMYVMDNWGWKTHFSNINSTYSNKKFR